MENVKKALNLAQNEIEEKQVQNLKNIIKNLLQKKVNLEEDEAKIKGEIKLIKQDIDDFKAGRLDKIKERHEVDERANKVAPINITIVQDPIYFQYPLNPWRWNYTVGWGIPVSSTYCYNTIGGSSTTLTNTSALGVSTTCGLSAGSNSILNCSGSSMTLTGLNSANFVGGAYSVSGLAGPTIINL